jgi:hypothetical protein
MLEQDNDPLQVVVYISNVDLEEEYDFSKQAMQSMVEQINNNTVNGYLGHRNNEELAVKFPDIATAWVGAIYREEENRVYVRGVVDASQDNLKRWIRTGRTKQVSILGWLVAEERANKKPLVQEIELSSIDWTPLDHQGMDTGLVLTKMKNKEENKVMKIKKEELIKMINGFEEEEIELEKINQKLNVKAEEPANELLSKLRELLGVEEEAGKDRVFEEVNEVLSLATRMKEVEAEEKLKEKKEKVEKMIADKTENEEMKKLTMKMVSFNVADEEFEEIEEKINKFVSDEEITSLIGRMMVEEPVKKQKKTEKEYKYLKPKE